MNPLILIITVAGLGWLLYDTQHLSQQLGEARTVQTTQAKQLAELVAINQQQRDSQQALLARLDTLQRRHLAMSRQLDTLTHDNPDIKAWADTPLPADVGRLLDNTATGDDQPGPGFDPVRGATTGTHDQPATGPGTD